MCLILILLKKDSDLQEWYPYLEQGKCMLTPIMKVMPSSCVNINHSESPSVVSALHVVKEFGCCYIFLTLSSFFFQMHLKTDQLQKKNLRGKRKSNNQPHNLLLSFKGPC